MYLSAALVGHTLSLTYSGMDASDGIDRGSRSQVFRTSISTVPPEGNISLQPRKQYTNFSVRNIVKKSLKKSKYSPENKLDLGLFIDFF